jgi:RND family efflux transporter MFP subunit
MIHRDERLYLAVAVGAAALLGFATAFGAPAQPVPGEKSPSPQVLRQRFEQLTPAARWQLVEKATRGDKVVQPAVRGDLDLSVVARGSLESEKNATITSTVKTRVGTDPPTIKWLVDEGTTVKKGEPLCHLDDAPLLELLKARKQDAEAAQASKVQAAAQAEMLRQETQVSVRLAEIDARLAELDLKKYAGKDADEKEALQLKVERARLGVKRAAAVGKAREVQADADLRAKQVLFEEELARVRAIEEQIKACRIVAPQDGLLLYFVPEQTRGGRGRQHALVAQGEPVREGQVLFQIPDLSRMVANVRVPEALVSHVRGAKPGDPKNWQHAAVRVDAYPAKALKGHVTIVDTLPSQKDWFAADVKVYRTLVKIDEQLPGLRPGMSAEVRIDAGRRVDVLRVPIQSVLHDGKSSFCYVKSGKEIHKRTVETGAWNDLAVEVRQGLKEGDEVILDPPGLLRSLSPWLAPG